MIYLPAINWFEQFFVLFILHVSVVYHATEMKIKPARPN